MNESTFDVFLSYHWRDHDPAEALARALKDRGLMVFLDRWYLVPGRPWPEALEAHLNRCRSVAVIVGPSGMGSWQQREQYLALDRQAREPSFAVIPVLLPGANPALGFLSLNTWIDLRGGIDDPRGIDLLTAAVHGEAPAEIRERTAAAVARVCPYRGLEVFREEDAPFFFGREAFTDKLCRAVASRSLVAVVGASGCGKSSVVRAGLVPQVRRAGTGTVWEVALLKPGNRPSHALSAALMPLLEPDMTETDRLVEINKQADYLDQGRLELGDVVTRALERQTGTNRLLLVVDQWEELYTHADAAGARAAVPRFVEQILRATDAAPLTVVLTLRADFFGEALSHRGLADRLQDAVINLGPMTEEERRQAVVAPAARVGLEFDSGLVDLILADAGDAPGNLPLLEYALRELWESRRGDRLHHEAYKAMGGVQGAIAQRAEKIYTDLTPAEQQSAKSVFTQLVRPGEESGGARTGDTRRRALLGEMNAAERAIVRKLADARLLVTNQETAAGEETVEVAHEALLYRWTRLRKWIDGIRKRLEDQYLLQDIAEKWAALGRPKFGGLVSGRQLRDFRRAGAPTRLARDYLIASVRFIVLKYGLVALLVTSLSTLLWWGDREGLAPKNVAGLLLFRAGLYRPEWIPEMVEIKPGTFLMGSPLEGGGFAAHRVTLDKPFRIGKHEATFDQYCASNRRRCPDDEHWGRGRHPVINVNWIDARRYANWLSRITGLHYRLPTEAEWEYAARAGSSTRYWWGEEMKPGMANCEDCGSDWKGKAEGKHTAKVGSFEANPFGLHDMAGNVWEWTEDCWHVSARGAPADGSAWLEGGGDCGRRVLRGGSWKDKTGDLQSAARRPERYAEVDKLTTIGFRFVQDLE